MIPRTRPNFDAGSLLSALRHGREAGRACAAVETEVSRRLEGQHVQLAPSGRGALYLLLHALPPGRVCVPGYTCSAVAEAAELAGRDVMHLEHRDGRINLAATDIDGRLLPGDILILTHQYGYPAMDTVAILESATAQGALVVEDIAAAFAGTLGDRPLGSFGIASFGSFDVSKLVHAPLKGGFVATSDPELSECIRAQAQRMFQPMSLSRKLALGAQALLLCLLTRTRLYRVFHWLNFSLRGRRTAEDGRLATRPNGYYLDRFAEWQAAVLLPQLRDLDRLLARRATVFARLQAACTDHPAFGIEDRPPTFAGSTVRFPLYATSSKPELYERLLSLGVDCGFSFSSLSSPPELERSWDIADAVLNLPYYPALTDRELDQLDQAMERIRMDYRHAA